MQPEPGRSQGQQVATDEAEAETDPDPDEDELEEPPELLPGFMPSFRRLLSRMLKPGKRLKIKRRVPSLSTLLARFAEQSKFLRTAPPPAPKPESRPPPDRPPPLKPRFRKPAGPKM